MPNKELANEEKFNHIKRDNNPFTFKGSLGRGGYLLTLIGIAFFLLISFMLAYFIFRYSQNEIIAEKIVKTIQFTCYATIFYVMALANMKRLYDIIENKRKAIFYILSFIIVINTIRFIPIITYIIKPLNILLLILLLFIPNRRTFRKTECQTVSDN